ncbi:hypothetical protein FKR81_32055 [Lentzea tibetensis]|uniref:Uncharacterized protein n=1 Tax=Lentzea tibetensis TaxID=2591470 RepID=A0A563EKU5_9PSEU|nr:hypothetical protein [Lentzea tibetensis]TWP47593.1 hypothetical protein FKR81_32055 [Lentzea tibetensis]
MRFRKLTAVASAAVGIAACVLVAPAANAAPPVAAAGSGAFVIWRDTNFTGLSASMNNHLPRYGNLVYAGTSVKIDDSASSAANYAPDFVLMAFRDGLDACDHTAPLLLFLRQGQVSAQESWFYANLGSKGFDNKISGHCFRG